MKLNQQPTLFAPRSAGPSVYRPPETFASLPAEDRFLALAHLGHNVFLTGMAGTGKTTLLRQFIGDIGDRRIDLTATTGIAALNLGGMTINRFCGMMIGPENGESYEACFERLLKLPYPSVRAGHSRVRSAECVVIDEISMMPGRQLDFVEWLFRRLRDRDEPFGGCQIVATGDFLQLPPVRAGMAAKNNEPYDWAFMSPAWERAEFKPIVLLTVRRQDEKRFVELLSNFRNGSCCGDDATILMNRVLHFPPAKLTRLMTHNNAVDRWNNIQLAELAGDVMSYSAVHYGAPESLVFLKKHLLTPEVLEVKIGCRVMFTVNKSVKDQREPVFVNGQTGTVVDVGCELIEDKGGRQYQSSEVDSAGFRDYIAVERDGDGEVVSVGRYAWEYGKGKDVAVFKQFPLRLAYAMTIHKAQGLTLDEALIDIAAARDPGQAYVAVSRVRKLDGLNLRGWFKGLYSSPDAVKFYRGLK